MSNSLTDLNSFSLDSIVFEDQRDYAITFSAASTANTSTSIAEDESFVVPTGIDITRVISQPGNITYTVSNATADVVASWPTPLPSGISNISAGNVFSITGTFNSETWTQARGLVMTAPDREEDFSFDATLTYPDPANVAQTDTWNWNNTVVITETNQDWINITVPRSYINNNFDFLFPDTVPAISDDSGNEYVVTLTTSSDIGIITLDNSLTAPSDWDFDTLTFSFTGNRTQVNQMLGQIRFIANLGADSTATVQLNSTTDPDIPFTASFDLNHQSALHLVKPALDIVYNEDQTDPVVDGANIATVQTTTHFTQHWSVVISQQLDDEPANNLAKLGGTGWTVISGPNPFYPRAIFKSSGPVTTVTDLLSRFNVFDTVTVGAAPDADVDYVLRVETGTELVPNEDTFQQTPQVFIRGVFVGETHEEFNFPDTGSYIVNTLLTMPTPLITDLDPTVNTDPAFQAYNLQITQESGAPGAFFVNGSQTPEAGRLAFISDPVGVQLSNTKDPINSLNIEFMPAVNNSDPVQLRYTQFKSNELSGNVAQANVLSTYTGTPVVHIINMTDRTFVDQQTNAIFANSTPEITDGSQQAQTYTITLSSTAGLFGNSVANAVSTSSYTFTGTRSECNTEFSNMVFVPNVTESGLPTNNTFTYTQTRSDTVQVNQVQNLVKSSSAAISPIDQAFDSTGTFEFSEQQALYGKITLVTVGGGGGGGGSQGSGEGGGGGGAEVVISNGSRTGNILLIQSGTVDFVVGSGGAASTAGSNSFVISNSVTLFNALGGQPGNTTHGGSSGVGRPGGLVGSNGFGGGAGYSAPFPDGTINPGSSFDGGDGESGLSVTIGTAFDAFYGGGGGGAFNQNNIGRPGNGSRRSARGGGGFGNAQPGLANSGGGGGGLGAAGGSGRIILKIR